jgi:hypothetical protein
MTKHGVVLQPCILRLASKTATVMTVNALASGDLDRAVAGSRIFFVIALIACCTAA